MFEPLDTDDGPEHAVGQSSYNKDMSCTKGFCPRFVAIEAPVPSARRLQGISAAGYPTLMFKARVLAASVPSVPLRSTPSRRSALSDEAVAHLLLQGEA